MNHNYFAEFETIKLRPLVEADIEPLRLLRNKNRYCFVNNTIITSEQQTLWFKNYLDKRDDITFSICCPSMTFAGVIALYDIDYEASSAEFGRIVVSERAPRLTGTYAIEAILFFARDVLKINTVKCSVLNSNARAILVYERIGFKITATDERLSYYSIDLKNFTKLVT